MHLTEYANVSEKESKHAERAEEGREVCNRRAYAAQRQTSVLVFNLCWKWLLVVTYLCGSEMAINSSLLKHR